MTTTSPSNAAAAAAAAAADHAVRFRCCRPTDLPDIAQLEARSYPADEAASMSSLQYRQHHAARYFRCAILRPTTKSATTSSSSSPDNNSKKHAHDDDDDDHDAVIGFVCSTRCHRFTHASMGNHVSTGNLLAIHSVVVAEEYRRRGIATKMLLDYIENVKTSGDDAPEKIVLLAKANLLSFYVKCGFRVMRPSCIEHGQDLWYDLELDIIDDRPPCYIVDAFADPSKAGTGNPAAVVILREPPPSSNDSEWMQTVAQEFNLSETAFLWKASSEATEEGNNEKQEEHFEIRYFTPTTEVPLCGHATLASAAIMYETLVGTLEKNVVFHAPQDVLRASCANRLRPGATKIAMTFPTKPVTEVASNEDRSAVISILQTALNIKQDDILYIGISEGLGDLLVEVTSRSFHQIGYENLRIDGFLAWDGYSRGVIVCCTEGPSEQLDFSSRFFGPKKGIMEDPVTGSAHCALAPYFGTKLAKHCIVGKQCSQRGGVVECELDDSKSTVKITGTAVTAVTGTLSIRH